MQDALPPPSDRLPDVASTVARWGPWAIVGLGLAALYVPTLYRLSTGLWTTDQQGHGPIVLALAAWLMGRRSRAVMAMAPQPQPALGWPLLLASLTLYVLGRSQDVLLLEVGSSIGVLIASILLLRGRAALRPLAFGLFFMLFLIPLPGPVVDALTQPMKLGASYAAEHLLFALGYPIARSGVILQIGQYQLLVADACAGLHTLFVLEAMGLLYLNLVRYRSLLRNVVLAALIVPISFAANVIRVVVLCLVTYHLGDDAGRGFLHGFAGIVVFLAALILIVMADSSVRLVARARGTA